MTTVAADLLLDAQDVSKFYGAVVALRSASLAVRPGEVHALMGANGAGKSTLVKILAGVYRPDTGSLRLDGVEIEGYTTYTPEQAVACKGPGEA